MAGNTLINAGFDGFRELYISGADPVQWDIDQLKNEQAVLQAVHHKYLSDKNIFSSVSGFITNSEGVGGKLLDDRSTAPGGVDILNYESRVQYGCKLLGYGVGQGCAP